MRGLVNAVAVSGELAQVRGGATSRHSAVDFHNRAEDGIREWQTGPPRASHLDGVVNDGLHRSRRRFGHAGLLVRLSGVVQGPLLAVGDGGVSVTVPTGRKAFALGRSCIRPRKRACRGGGVWQDRSRGRCRSPGRTQRGPQRRSPSP